MNVIKIPQGQEPSSKDEEEEVLKTKIINHSLDKFIQSYDNKISEE